jgi:hypothetical protein
LTDTTATRRTLTRFTTGLLAASMALGVFGTVNASAASTYSTSAPMILQNVPPEDLIANTHGICDGSFNIAIRNAGTTTGAVAYLNAAQKCGLKVVFFFSTTVSGGTVYPSRVAPFVNAVKNHPALFGYLSVKEPSWIGITGAEIRTMYRAFKAADSAHPVVALFGDIPHFGGTANPYTAGMANIVMVDWYPVETASGGCSASGSTYIPYGPKWYSTKVRPTVAAKTPWVPIWVMVQTHKYLAPRCHKKQRPTASQLVRQVREAFTYARASGIAFHSFRNDNYQSDQRRDPAMVGYMKSISGQVRAGTF